MLITDAVERGEAARNPVRELRSARTRGREDKAERRRKGKLRVGEHIPSPDEVAAILASINDLSPRTRALVTLSVSTGLRSSELRGLSWRAVDFRNKELRVTQRCDRYGVLGRPKSETSERTLPIPPITLATLREWKLQCPKSEAGFVFVTPNGKPMHKTEALDGIHRAQRRAKVAGADGRPKYNLKAFRHFYASWLINPKSAGGLGLSLKLVSERMGHSTVALTANIYAHLFPRGDDHAELAAAEASLFARRDMDAT